MIKINYKDKERDVIIVNRASDNYFMLDLSEYSKEEQEFYENGFKELHNKYIADLKELGVSSNYRYFNKDKIGWIYEDAG